MADLLTRLCRQFEVRAPEARAWLANPATAPRVAQDMIREAGGPAAAAPDPIPAPPAAEEAPPASADSGEGVDAGEDDSGV